MATNTAPYTEAVQKNIYRDIAIEWRTLAALLDESNIDWINRLSNALFTGNRVKVLQAMQKSYTEYGTITFEGLNRFLEGEVPGELFNVQGANIRASAYELARLAKKRQAKKTSVLLSDLSEEFDPAIDAIQEALLIDPIMAEEDGRLITGAQILLADLHQKRSGEYKFAKTGLKFLDSAMGGEWKPKSLVIYMGGPGTGKTTLAAQSMLNMAEGYTIESTGEHIVTPSLFFSLEMAKEDLMVKWIGNKLEIDTRFIQSGQLSQDEFASVEEMTIYLQNLPMYVIEKGDISLASMVYEIRKYVRNHGVRVVFVDYLQIVNHHPTGNDNSDLGEFAAIMKRTAKQENITIVVLSQMTPGKDGVFKIRDSGEVGAVADVVIQGILDDDEPGGMKTVSIDKLKNRFGPTGGTGVLFNGPYQRFEEGSL